MQRAGCIFDVFTISLIVSSSWLDKGLLKPAAKKLEAVAKVWLSNSQTRVKRQWILPVFLQRQTRCAATMKGLPVFLGNLAFLSLIVLAQGLTASELLSQKENEMRFLADSVKENYGLCDLLKDCSGLNCSRPECYQYATDDSNYSCQNVTLNLNCGSDVTCLWKRFDFSESFVGLAVLDQISARSVCTQRMLDAQFKTMSNQTNFFRVYLGGLEGTMRIYPGSDEGCVYGYDPRIRPWYLQSISVQKAVILLVDSGPSMQQLLNAGQPGETYISKAINISLKFLDTLQKDDYIKVMLFNGGKTNVQPVLNDYFVQVVINNTDNKPLLLSLRERLSATDFGVITGSQDPNATDASNAINEAIAQLLGSSAVPATKYLKVIIVLTGGLFIETLPQTRIQNSGVNLFVYKLKTTRTEFVECDGGVQASFEEIPVAQIDNPLYALRSYYSFLAKIHSGFMKNRIDYSQQYVGWSEQDKSTFTLSKAVFGPNGELLGVVGIDFSPNKVEEQYQIVLASLVQAANEYPRIPPSFDPSKDLHTSVCFNHTDPCESVIDKVTIENNGLCAKGTMVEDETRLRKLSCCGECSKTTKEIDWPTGKLAGVIVAGVLGAVGLVLLVTGCFYFISTQKSWMNSESKTFWRS